MKRPLVKFGLFRSFWMEQPPGFWAAVFAGLALRVGLIPHLNPSGGDPVFSYAYRGLLLADGQWEGLFLMWHPPGFPLLLGALHGFTGKVLSPYTWGLLVNLGSYVALVCIVDRGMARLQASTTARQFTALGLVFWESLFYWQAIPVTEPLYLAILYGVIVGLLYWEDTRAIFALGAVLGVAGSMRREGVVLLAGMVLWLLREPRRGGKRGPALVAGFLLTSAWIFADPRLGEHIKAQEFSYTVAPVVGVGAQLARAVECAYRALIDWLPQVALLPFWVIGGIGLAVALRRPQWDRAQALLACVLLPTVAAVALSIQHKRTGIFLLPALAIYFGLGCSYIAEIIAERWPRWRAPAVALLMAIVIGQSFRILWNLHKAPPPTDQITLRQARLLSSRPPGKVWAFGNEPEIYAYWGVPGYYPFDERIAYGRLFQEREGNMEGFLATLKERGIRYLTFTLVGDGPRVPQLPYGIVEPPRKDLAALRDLTQSPDSGLTEVGRDRIEASGVEVFLLELDGI